MVRLAWLLLALIHALPAIALIRPSLLTMLIAAEDGRKRWWAAYAVASCAAMYTHYTAAFVLIAQLGWLFWAMPEARKAALLSNVGAAILFLPWLPVFVFQGAEDFTTPTDLARRYVDSIRAPRKAFVPIVGGGHFAVFMKSDAFLKELVARVLPLAQRR